MEDVAVYREVEEAGNNTSKDVANMQNFKVISDQVFHNIKMDTNSGQNPRAVNNLEGRLNLAYQLLCLFKPVSRRSYNDVAHTNEQLQQANG